MKERRSAFRIDDEAVVEWKRAESTVCPFSQDSLTDYARLMQDIRSIEYTQRVALQRVVTHAPEVGDYLQAESRKLKAWTEFFSTWVVLPSLGLAQQAKRSINLSLTGIRFYDQQACYLPIGTPVWIRLILFPALDVVVTYAHVVRQIPDASCAVNAGQQAGELCCMFHHLPATEEQKIARHVYACQRRTLSAQPLHANTVSMSHEVIQQAGPVDMTAHGGHHTSVTFMSNQDNRCASS